MTLVEAALACPQCVVSVMGPHAGEDADTIFERKKADIEKLGKTFWFMKSPKARPEYVQVTPIRGTVFLLKHIPGHGKAVIFHSVRKSNHRRYGCTDGGV